MNPARHFLNVLIAASLLCCKPAGRESTVNESPSAFDDDLAFLSKYTSVIVLSDQQGLARIAVVPALQARVMTSTAGNGESFGWINRKHFESGDTSVHINVFGGEERFWLGPEGGQFSIFFDAGKEFNLENWKTPRLIDLDTYELVSRTEKYASFRHASHIVNYSGTRFDLTIHRRIAILERDEAFSELGASVDTGLHVVAFRSENAIENSGSEAWRKDRGLLSIWLLGMFKPSPQMTVVIPFHPGPEDRLGRVVVDDYFGKVPSNRLKVADSVIYFRGDGSYRSKIGLGPSRAKNIIGSYDPYAHMLTVVKYTKPPYPADYVNSKWEIQAEPYKGDVVNSYNDGPPAPGVPPLGPFYELETSSPALALAPGERLAHTQVTFHFQGSKESLDNLTRRLFGVTVEQITSAFR